MASGGRPERRVRAPERAASVVVPLPRRAGTSTLARLLPSRRSLAAALALLVGAAGSYVVARETSVFAVRSLAVQGAPPSVAVQVRRALQSDLGTSLLALDLARARAALAALPTVASASFDRAFPHTLRVAVVPERPVAVVRSGARSWLVSARGRVMASLARGARPRLPRIWVGGEPSLTAGGSVPAELRSGIEAVAPLRAARFPARVASVRSSSDELTLVLRSGLEVRLGDPSAVALKLAVAAKVLPLIGGDTRYVDVSAPDRPVAGSSFTSATRAPARSAPASDGGPHQVAQREAVSLPTLNSQVETENRGSTQP